jgi:hypothetical protein
MSQQSDMADVVYSRLSSEPVSAAHLVRELRSRWGVEHGVGSVHGFVREVATCLLHHDDVEVGDVTAGRFVPWQLASWDADEKIDAELMTMDLFLDDESKYVFRKRPVAYKSPEPTPVGACRSASRLAVFGPAWLSFFR